MKLVLQIFRKDALYLWKEILVTWVLLAWLTQLDCWRSGYLPDSNEGWLNLLLPLTWIYLSGLCVLQDPVPGERPFWLALPVRRGAVLSAKALFAAAFIHLPYFISCAIILVARGFNPVLTLPTLFMKQLAVLLILTVPAMALASLARNAMQFLLFAITLAGAAVVIGGKGASPFQRVPPLLTDTIRLEMVLVTMAVSFAAVLWIQYRDRRTRVSRAIGLAGALAAGVLYLWLPARSSAVVESSLRPVHNAQAIQVRVSATEARDQTPYISSNGVIASIPLEITGMPSQSGLGQIDFEIDAPGGHRFEANFRGRGASQPQGPALLADVTGQGHFLNIVMQRSIFSAVSRAPVALKGHLVITQMGDTIRRSIPNTQRSDVPDLGKCNIPLAEGTLYIEGGLRVVCESPDEIPVSRVTVTDTVTGRHWDGAFGWGGTFVSYPSLAWLSPVYRSESFFQITSAIDATERQNWWKIPRETLQHYRVDADITRVRGREVVGYELQGIELNKYLVKPSR